MRAGAELEQRGNSAAEVIEKMRKNGFRITEQRRILIDIILRDEHHCCKEIYYEALKRDPSIGMATVYRTIDVLQNMGILKRDYSRPVLSSAWNSRCRILLETGGKAKEEDNEALYESIREFLMKRGYLRDQAFRAMVIIEE